MSPNRYPPGVWLPIPENMLQPLITPTQIIVHTAVDHPGPSTLRKFFARPEIKVESTFFVASSGRVEQYLDANRRADANGEANRTAISVETEDDGDPVKHPWTPAQLSALTGLVRWCGARYGIPMRACPGPFLPGVGYHSMWGFADNVRLTGPVRNPWSPTFGKTCPGTTRVAQFWGTLLPSLTPAAIISPDIEDETMPRWMIETLAEATINRIYYEARDAGPAPSELRDRMAQVRFDLDGGRPLEALFANMRAELAGFRS